MVLAQPGTSQTEMVMPQPSDNRKRGVQTVAKERAVQGGKKRRRGKQTLESESEVDEEMDSSSSDSSSDSGDDVQFVEPAAGNGAAEEGRAEEAQFGAHFVPIISLR